MHGQEVPGEDLVKGFEADEGEYIVVEPDELDEIAPGRSQTIGISDFVDLEEIEPVYFDRTYYIAPRGKQYLTALRTGGDLFLTRGIPCVQALRRCGHG